MPRGFVNKLQRTQQTLICPDICEEVLQDFSMPPLEMPYAPYVPLCRPIPDEHQLDP